MANITVETHDSPGLLPLRVCQYAGNGRVQCQIGHKTGKYLKESISGQNFFDT